MKEKIEEILSDNLESRVVFEPPMAFVECGQGACAAGACDAHQRPSEAEPEEDWPAEYEAMQEARAQRPAEPLREPPLVLTLAAKHRCDQGVWGDVDREAARDLAVELAQRSNEARAVTLLADFVAAWDDPSGTNVTRLNERLNEIRDAVKALRTDKASPAKGDGAVRRLLLENLRRCETIYRGTKPDGIAVTASLHEALIAFLEERSETAEPRDVLLTRIDMLVREWADTDLRDPNMALATVTDIEALLRTHATPEKGEER